MNKTKRAEAAEQLAVMAETLGIKAPALDNFGRSIRAIARGLWNGSQSRSDFIVSMFSSIERYFRLAWEQGAAECGIKPDELSDDEKEALGVKIAEQTPHVSGFADFIEAGSKENGGLWRDVERRTQLWIGRYQQVQNQATAMACADKKLRWTLGDAEHCSSCVKLSGQVRRGSFWQERGILPRVAGASYLNCHGYRCQCDLVPTDEPMSKGRLPGLP